jgi:hypothetical protein
MTTIVTATALPARRRKNLGSKRLVSAIVAGLLALLALAPGEPAAAATPGGAPSQAPLAAPARPPDDPPPPKATPSPTPTPSGEDDPQCKHKGGALPQSPSVRCMTTEAVRTIFGLSSDSVFAKPTLGWILEVPDFVETPGRGIGDAEWLSEAIAFSLLLGMVTFTLLHYWAAGLSSNAGGAVVMDGVLRCVGAGLFILAWPFIFENVANLTNVVTSTLLPAKAIDMSILALTGVGTAVGAFGGPATAVLVGISIITAFVGLFLGLLVLKIGLMAGLVVAFIGVPIAVALWPLPSTSAPAGYALRFVGMVFTVMIMWALCFKAFGSVNTELATWGGDISISQKLLLPLIGLAELGAVMTVPRHAIAMWNIASKGNGIVATAAGFAASSFLAEGARKVPGGMGAMHRKLGERLSSRSGGSASAGKGSAGKGSAGAKTASSGKANGAGSASAGGAKGRPPGLPPVPKSAQGKAKAESARKAMMSMRKERSPGVAAVRAAVKAVDHANGGRFKAPLRELLGSDGGGTAGSVADQKITTRLAGISVATGMSGSLRVAWQRIGAATPEVRRSGLGLGGGAGDAPPRTTPSPVATPPSPPPTFG